MITGIFMWGVVKGIDLNGIWFVGTIIADVAIVRAIFG